MNRLHQILVKPLETEKAFGGQKTGKFIFQVKNDATKKEIGVAVEKYYGVKVKSVRTSKIQPKTRKAGRREIQKRSPAKKAIITTVGAKPIDVNKVRT
ncbi:50S ribosomal protein L23 [Patescibacteria group bacterium]|nr:50S ribosomal protein L23 [Patescibacteria group bacterium]